MYKRVTSGKRFRLLFTPMVIRLGQLWQWSSQNLGFFWGL